MKGILTVGPSPARQVPRDWVRGEVGGSPPLSPPLQLRCHYTAVRTGLLVALAPTIISQGIAVVLLSTMRAGCSPPPFLSPPFQRSSRFTVTTSSLLLSF